jgi:glucose/arabinose dehydrogenase
MTIRLVSCVILIAGCTGGHDAGVVTPPPGATTVTVPASMRSAPFDVPRSLKIPAGYRIAVYARVADARFAIVTPDGNLLVSVPNAGSVELVRPNPNGDPLVSTYVSGLNSPQGLAIHAVGGVTYVYVAEETQVARYVWTAGQLTPGARQVIVPGLPTGGSHPLKDLALDANNKLYVALGSSCNVCTNDLTSTPQRAAIYQYNADGTGGRLYANGLRNAEGLAILSATNTLWAAVNERDDIPYPYQDHSGNQFGVVYVPYVDNHPPDELTSVRDGGNYGWPYCNPTQDSASGYDNMAFDPSVDGGINDNGQVSCTIMDKVVKGIQAHSAPLGLTFTMGTNAPTAYRSGAVLGLHGSWDRSTYTGYKVIYVPFTGSQPAVGTTPIDLVTGWADDHSFWGRPVDVAIDAAGRFFITDDGAGAIYVLTAQ